MFRRTTQMQKLLVGSPSWSTGLLRSNTWCHRLFLPSGATAQCAPSHGRDEQSRVGTGRGRAAEVKERQLWLCSPIPQYVGWKHQPDGGRRDPDARQVSRGAGGHTRWSGSARRSAVPTYIHLDQISRAWVVPIVASAMPVVPDGRLQGKTWEAERASERG